MADVDPREERTLYYFVTKPYEVGEEELEIGGLKFRVRCVPYLPDGFVALGYPGAENWVYEQFNVETTQEEQP